MQANFQNFRDLSDTQSKLCRAGKWSKPLSVKDPYTDKYLAPTSEYILSLSYMILFSGISYCFKDTDIFGDTQTKLCRLNKAKIVPNPQIQKYPM